MDDNSRTVKELIQTLSKYDENERVRCFMEMGQFRSTLYCEDGDFGFFRNTSGELVLEVCGDVDHEDWVALHNRIGYNHEMDKLKELIKECMDQLESEFPGDHFDEQEAFEIVMEMIQDQVNNYTFTQYKK